MANHFAPVFKLIDAIAMTSAQREAMYDSFRSAMQSHGREEYERGHRAGLYEGGQVERRTEERIRYELLDTVRSALGIEED